jgi:hypothetical protein
MQSALPALACAVGYAAVLLGSPACTDEKSGARYYPLREGARWEFEAHYEQEGAPVASERDGRRIEIVEGSEERSGRQYLVLASTLEGIGTEPVTGRALVRVDPDGVYIRGEAADDETLLLPSPLVVGQTWSWQDSWGHWEGTALRELSVETPAGRFERCVEVSLVLASVGAVARGGVRRVLDYCRGVGPVRQVWTTQVESPAGPLVGVTTELLTSAELP